MDQKFLGKIQILLFNKELSFIQDYLCAGHMYAKFFEISRKICGIVRNRSWFLRNKQIIRKRYITLSERSEEFAKHMHKWAKANHDIPDQPLAHHKFPEWINAGNCYGRFSWKKTYKTALNPPYRSSLFQLFAHIFAL